MNSKSIKDADRLHYILVDLQLARDIIAIGKWNNDKTKELAYEALDRVAMIAKKFE